MYNFHALYPSGIYCNESMTYIYRRDDCMFSHGTYPKGLLFAAFGLGILLGLYFPVKAMLFILALMLIALGVITCQR